MREFPHKNPPPNFFVPVLLCILSTALQLNGCCGKASPHEQQTASNKVSMDRCVTDYLETLCLYRKRWHWERPSSCEISVLGNDATRLFGRTEVKLLPWCCGVALMCVLVAAGVSCDSAPGSPRAGLTPVAPWTQCCAFKHLHSILLGETESEIQTFISSVWFSVGSWVCSVAFIHKTNVTANKRVPFLWLGDR